MRFRSALSWCRCLSSSTINTNYYLLSLETGVGIVLLFFYHHNWSNDNTLSRQNIVIEAVWVFNYLISPSHGKSKHCLSGKFAVITSSVNIFFDFTIAKFMNWSLKAGQICCLGCFWVVAGRVRQVVFETRFVLMEKASGGNWSGL